MHIKKGDNVIMISGKDKGKKGKVIRALPKENQIIIEGINIKKRHQKPRKANQKGQVVELSAPVHVSNAMLLDPKTGERTRVGFKIEDGKKVRYSKKT